MNKIINFLKTNYFIKGLILLGFGLTELQIVEYSPLSDTTKGYLSLIGLIIVVISFVFLVISSIREKLLFKILSTIGIFFIIFLLGYVAISVIYVDLQKVPPNQSTQFKNITQQYNDCMNKSNEKLLRLQEESAKDLTPEEWQKLQREYIQADLDLIKCLNEIFKGNPIYIQKANK